MVFYSILGLNAHIQQQLRWHGKQMYVMLLKNYIIPGQNKVAFLFASYKLSNRDGHVHMSFTFVVLSKTL